MNKLVIIPDSFKGTLSSSRIGKIIGDEAVIRWPHAEIVRLTVADGGEGSVDAFLSASGGEKRPAAVSGPYGEKIESFYGRFGDTAIIEMAAAAGLPLVGAEKSAGKTTTYGVGELMLAALRDGAKKIILGLGGSATNDGGTGAAAALGARFLNGEGRTFIPVGETLKEIKSIDLSGLSPLLREAEVTAICDIDCPLCGPGGAAAVFAPQKGASASEVKALDEGLYHLAALIKRDINEDVLTLCGGGAAGGMGAGAAAFFKATLKSGIDTMLDAIGFDKALCGCSLVITGEGKIDGQSVRGKVVAGVARRAAKMGVPVIAIVGDIGDGASAMYDIGVSAIFSINRVAVSYGEAKLRAAGDLTETARTIFKFMELSKKI